MGTTQSRARWLGWTYLVASALTVGGTLWAQLGATSATTLAGGEKSGAFYTGFLLALFGISAAAGTLLSPRVAARLGTGRAFVILTFLVCLTSGSLGALLLVFDAPIGTLMAGMPIAGALSGAAAVLAPAVARAYLGGTSLANAYAVRSVASGVGAALGALSAAAVIYATEPGWGLIGNAVLSAPIALLVLVRPPIDGFPPARPRGAHSSAAGGGSRRGPRALAALRTSPALRRTAHLGAAVSIFVAPLISMIVPIAQALRQSPLVPGAGIVLAGVALGRLATPLVVTPLQRGRDDLTASFIAISCTGGLMLVLALSALVVSNESELVVWAVVAVAMGATRFASRSLTLGAADSSLGPGRGLEGVAAVVLVSAASMPIGTLGWGLALGAMPPWAVVAIGGCGVVAAAALLRLSGRRRAEDAAATPAS